MWGVLGARFTDHAGTEGQELEDWAQCLLRQRKRRTGSDAVLSKVVEFMSEHDKESLRRLDEEIQALTLQPAPLANEPVKPDVAERTRQNVTPAKYRAAWRALCFEYLCFAPCKESFSVFPGWLMLDSC